MFLRTFKIYFVGTRLVNNRINVRVNLLFTKETFSDTLLPKYLVLGRRTLFRDDALEERLKFLLFQRRALLLLFLLYYFLVFHALLTDIMG